MNFGITVDPEKELGVDLRELYEALGSRQDFSTWAKSRLAGYDDGQDFGVFHNPVENSGGRPRKDYAVSIDVAKHIAMMENTERGREVRRYFIDCEKQLRETATAPAQLTKMEILEMALESERKVTQLEQQNARLLPDAQFGKELKDSDNLLTITQVAKPLNLTGQGLNQFLKTQGIIFRQSGDWMPYGRWGRKGFFKIVAHTIDTGEHTRTTHQLKVTAEGRAFIHDLWRKHNQDAA